VEIDRLFSLIGLGEQEEAARHADPMLVKASFGQPEPITLYRLACVYSLSVAAVEEARRPNPLTEADKKLQAAYRAKAVDALERSFKNGFRDIFNTQTDADLAPIRGPEFDAILDKYKRK
jgi:hypothetical protein